MDRGRDDIEDATSSRGSDSSSLVIVSLARQEEGAEEETHLLDEERHGEALVEETELARLALLVLGVAGKSKA